MSVLRALNTTAGTDARIKDFISVARYVALAHGDPLGAAQAAEAAGASPVVVSVLRSAVSAGSLADPAWAAPLSPYGSAMGAFLGSLRNASAFDRLLPDMKSAPLRTRIASASAGIAGHVVAEGAATPLSALTLTSNILNTLRAVAVVAVSDELARAAGEEGLNFLERELRAAVAIVTDMSFVAALTAAGGSTAAASGTMAAAVLADLATAAGAVATCAESKLYALTSPAITKSLSFKATTTGALAFEQMTPAGGIISGIPVIPSDAISGSVVVVDAAAIVANPGTITIEEARHASMQMSDTPDSPVTASTVFASLWQMNMTGVKATRWFGVEVPRSNAVATITGASY